MKTVAERTPSVSVPRMALHAINAAYQTISQVCAKTEISVVSEKRYTSLTSLNRTSQKAVMTKVIIFFVGALSVELLSKKAIEMQTSLFVCGISLTSGQLNNELFPDCRKVMLFASCFTPQGR